AGVGRAASSARSARLSCHSQPAAAKLAAAIAALIQVAVRLMARTLADDQAPIRQRSGIRRHVARRRRARITRAGDAAPALAIVVRDALDGATVAADADPLAAQLAAVVAVLDDDAVDAEEDAEQVELEIRVALERGAPVRAQRVLAAHPPARLA